MGDEKGTVLKADCQVLGLECSGEEELTNACSFNLQHIWKVHWDAKEFWNGSRMGVLSSMAFHSVDVQN